MVDTLFPRGLYELIDAYDGFIIDQWGVLHNGFEAHKGAIEVLKQLKKHNKQVIISSNSAKRCQDNKERLTEFGIKPSYYIDMVTSGEVTWQGLKEQIDPPFQGLGKKCFLISKKADKSILKDLEVEKEKDIEQADFVLITGFNREVEDLKEHYDERLKIAVKRRLPAICANPDMISVYGSSKYQSAGAVAARYRELGGTVEYIGKPHKAIFRYCLKKFDKVMPSRVLVIGDSIQHDILGANNVDLDSMFIMSGIHGNEFKSNVDGYRRQKALNRVISLYGGIAPKYAMPELIWQTKEAAYDERQRLKNA